ncbi:carbohydrate ABC transporter permease [Nocardioides marmorisolisilvae]|uniref:Sugar ABC transporter permease n=1 Tax=Nocardioides marmorisolisilvae TaxID=1542737 RepID=A0A3N0DQP3_9ACTN|nr:sugar ABC transporter permease [Nocardioides marmorisolisilvae]RNL77811.1 sugar ABC transporter permease [Nocardioides marmorisolisilvae]
MANAHPAGLVWKRRLPGLVMASPAVIVFLAMFMVPMVLAFVLSLTDWNGFSLRFEWVGFDNYATAFKNPRVVHAATFTFVVALIGTILCNGMGLAVACLISGTGALNTVARTVFFYPYIISALIIGFLWSALLAPQGVVNNILTQLGAPPVPFLSDPGFAKWTLIFTIVWSTFGFNMILYIAGLKSIPAEYYEAAMVDGATPWLKFRHITFPLLAPVTTVNLVLTIVGLLKSYDIVLALTDGGPAGSTQTVVYEILRDSFVNARLGFGSAQAVILLIVTGAIAVAVTLTRRGAEMRVSE